MNLDLKGRKALVCGASQGIGEGIARALAEQGARVILVARNKSKLESLATRLDGEGHSYLANDLEDKIDVAALVEYIKSEKPGIIINNTGGPKPGEIVEAEISQFEKGLSMHLFVSHQLMQAALPAMKQEGYGRFINVISTSVKMPIPGLGVSNTVRGAMASWSKTLSMEVGPFGVTVNNILPGFIDTDRLGGLIQTLSEKQEISKEEVTKNMISTIPAGRFGKPSEIGNLAAFLASDAGAYINGVSIPVDGGKAGAL